MAGPFLHSGAWVTTVAANDTTQREELGILRFEGAKIYRYVKMTGGAATAFEAASYAADTTTSIKQTPAASTAAGQSVAGITESAITSGSFGWLTVYGGATAKCDTAATVGLVLVPSTTAGVLAGRHTIHGAVATTGGNQVNNAAIALTTGVATGSSVFVNCL